MKRARVHLLHGPVWMRRAACHICGGAPVSDLQPIEIKAVNLMYEACFGVAVPR
jgi:hypothetical protein